MLTYAHVCSLMLTYADVCSCMLTYAHVCSRSVQLCASESAASWTCWTGTQFTCFPGKKSKKNSDAEGAARILPKLKAAGHRVLIYSQMVQLLEILAEYIEGEGYIYRQLIGSTASEVTIARGDDC